MRKDKYWLIHLVSAALLVLTGCGRSAPGSGERTGEAAQAVGPGPDLVVSSVSSPPSVVPGGAFTATVTVCNQGTLASGGTTVQVRLSTDTVINTSDVLAGTASVPALGAGQCS